MENISLVNLRNSSSDVEDGGRKRSVSSPDSASNHIRKKKQAIEHIRLIQTNGEQIEERYGHSAVVDTERGRMFIFGGCSTNTNLFLEDVYYLSFQNQKWYKIASPSNKIEKTENQSEEMAQEIARVAKIWPRGRHFHNAVSFKGNMYIFGGKSNGYMADIWALDYGSLEWREIFPSGQNRINTRYGHSGVIYNDSMFIFGGYDGFGLQCNDLWEFNFTLNEWKKVKTLGTAPERYHHSAVVFEGSMYIWGGHGGDDLYEYRFGTCVWSLINTKGIPPPTRWGHKAVVIRRCMYIFGGCDTLTNFNDVFRYHFDTNRWEKLKMGGEYPQGYFQSAVNYNDKIYIFGGRNIHNYDFNDLYEIRLEFDSNLNPNTFIDDFRNLLYDNEFSDVTFHFPREGREISAHRHILYCRCKRFREVIENVKIPSSASSLFSRSSSPSTAVSNIATTSNDNNPPHQTTAVRSERGKVKKNSKSKRSQSTTERKKKKKKKELSNSNESPPPSSSSTTKPSQHAIESSDNKNSNNQTNRDEQHSNIIIVEEKKENDTNDYINNLIHLNITNDIIDYNERPHILDSPKLVDWNPPSFEKFVINIEDISYDTFRRLLEYIYCGIFDVSSALAFEFLPIANFYELDHLKNLCAYKIQRSIDTSNVLYALTLADACKVNDLKQFCLSFIFNNRKEVSPALKNGGLDGELLKEVKKYLTVHSLEQQFKAKSIYSLKPSH